MSTSSDDRRSSGRPQVLHLGFQDFRQPGSGGGAVRTYEINRRLTDDFDVTVLTSRYRGSRERVEDGVRYVHVGRALGYFGSILTYFLAVPFALRKYRSDLVVEDFAAPFSSCLSPLWTHRKVVAMVQWLNAREKSKQYHLPFWIIEKWGLRLHHRYIAVSEDLADQIRLGSPGAEVTVIANGVPTASFEVPLDRERHDIVFLGRLERQQKGLDLLLDAYAAIAGRTSADLLLIGDGPDEAWLRSRITELGLVARVRLLGRLDGVSKDVALATAKVVAMPSRFETFGMVAVESFALGTPVVAFGIPCLKEVVPDDLGALVTAFDVPGYGASLLDFVDRPRDPEIEKSRRTFARQYDWETLAAMQSQVYAQLITG